MNHADKPKPFPFHEMSDDDFEEPSFDLGMETNEMFIFGDTREEAEQKLKDKHAKEEAKKEFAVQFKVRRVRLYPTTKQREVLNHWFGVARWTYNQCLLEWNKDEWKEILQERSKDLFYQQH